MLDKDLIQRKIALIQDDLQHLVAYEKMTIGRALDINQHIIAECGGGLESIKRYRDTFLRLVDLKIYPQDFAEILAQSAGLRNALVHEYNNIDPAILQKSIGQAIKEFNRYTQHILAFTDRQP